ncbi:MAG: hypothetical protein ACLTXZ_05995 [Oscillospiraceae bacterium]
MDKEIIRAPEIAERLECSQGEAYKIIRKLNEELIHEGLLVVKGRVPRTYFEERYRLVKPIK